jgi:hypothetical protein
MPVIREDKPKEGSLTAGEKTKVGSTLSAD